MAFPQTVDPSIPNQANLAGDPLALALTMFSGEVLAAFKEKNVFMNLTRSMNVGAGSSHQFPIIGKASAKRHVRGENILDDTKGYLNKIEHAERRIQVDRPLLAPFTVDDWDEMIAHAPFRQEYATQVGEALARSMDQQVAQVLVLAARGGNPLTAAINSGRGGKVISKASVDTSATAMIEAMIEAAVSFEEKDVRSSELQFYVKPSMYFALANEGSLIDRDFNPEGNGSKASGLVMKGYGFHIGMSNNIPSAPVDPGIAGTEFNTYSGDFTKTQAIGFHRDAVGTVYREGVTVETQRKAEYQQDLVIARLITGTGILRSECACEIALP